MLSKNWYCSGKCFELLSVFFVHAVCHDSSVSLIDKANYSSQIISNMMKFFWQTEFNGGDTNILQECIPSILYLLWLCSVGNHSKGQHSKSHRKQYFQMWAWTQCYPPPPPILVCTDLTANNASVKFRNDHPLFQAIVGHLTIYLLLGVGGLVGH